MRSSDFLQTVVPTNSKVFWVNYDYVGIEDLSKGY